MPRGFHPCFRSQVWTAPDDVVLEFQSDRHKYRYTAVPQVIFDNYDDGSLNGTDWNATVREAIGPYVRLFPP